MRVAVDSYILDVLMRDLVGHDRSPAAFLVYLCLWNWAAESRGLRVRASLRRLTEGTGLSKSAVQGGLRQLRRRGLLKVRRETVTAVPEYSLQRPWYRTK